METETTFVTVEEFIANGGKLLCQAQLYMERAEPHAGEFIPYAKFAYEGGQHGPSRDWLFIFPATGSYILKSNAFVKIKIRKIYKIVP